MPPERHPDDVTRAEAPPWRGWRPIQWEGQGEGRSRSTFGGAARRNGGKARKCDKVVPLKEKEAKVGRLDTLAVSSLTAVCRPTGDDRKLTILSASPSTLLSEYVDLDTRDLQW